MQADNAVIFASGQEPGSGEKRTGDKGIFGGGAMEAIYLSGDVLMTKGLRTIRANEMYYDFEQKKALAVKAVMRGATYAPTVVIPVHPWSVMKRLSVTTRLFPLTKGSKRAGMAWDLF